MVNADTRSRKHDGLHQSELNPVSLIQGLINKLEVGGHAKGVAI